MRRRGLFPIFFRMMFDFYGGMFRLTFFLPFVLMQVKNKQSNSIGKISN